MIKILIIVLFLVGCSSQQSVEVRDNSRQKVSTPKVHFVSRGETLFSIAWRYGVDYRELACFNGINNQYTIYPGQKIYLNLQPLTGKVVNKETAPACAQKAVVEREKPAGSKYRSERKRSENKTQISNLTPNNALSTGALKWQWPASGKLIAQFQGETGLNKGIDIGANLGESVLAAAAGQVVYAGSGLRGYGKLLIIKHNDIFLSAYAHNSELLVKEGDVVKVGQRIADMGSSGTDRVKLHFEIRSEGKPVDPLKYLPKR